MARLDNIEFPVGRQTLSSVAANRFEEAKGPPIVAARFDDEQRLVDQCLEPIENGPVCILMGTNRRGCFQGKRSGEDAQTREKPALLRREQRETPVDEGPQRLLSRDAALTREQPKASVELRAQLFEAEHFQSCRG